MYLLDTNVVSELRKLDTPRVDDNFAMWLAREPTLDRFRLAAPSLLEVERGIVQIGRRDPVQSALLGKWLDDYVFALFAGRILPFDTAAARATAQLAAIRTFPEIDSMLAGIAQVHDLTIATGNVDDFDGSRVPVVNPWDRSTWT